MSLRAALAALGAAVAALSPRLAHACAVCMSGREDDVQLAFIATTGLLSVLPLLAIGSFVWWARRRLREIERAQAERRTDAPFGDPATAPAPIRSRSA